MTKAKTKAQAAEVQVPATTEQPEQVMTGDGSGEALPEVAGQPEEQVAAAVQQPAPPEPDPEDVTDVLVLCDGSLDGITRYGAGSVLQGVPESLAQANSHWLDAHPSAVEHALNNGAAIIDYQQKA